MNARHPARRTPSGPSRLRTARGPRPSALLALTAVSLIALGGCASPSGERTAADAPSLGEALPDATSSPAAPTLYDDIGGKAGVASLTERFIREIATDERIRGHYRDSDMSRFYRMMQVQMCELTGGGCTYTGDDMRRTHGGMNITPTEFNGIVEALMRAMDAERLPIDVQNRILAIYAPMREDIVDR